jgi:hypothetical protein
MSCTAPVSTKHGVTPRKISDRQKAKRPSLFELGLKRVREEGIEPSQPNGHKVLNLARLPIPPLAQRSVNTRSVTMCQGDRPKSFYSFLRRYICGIYIIC